MTAIVEAGRHRSDEGRGRWTWIGNHRVFGWHVGALALERFAAWRVTVAAWRGSIAAAVAWQPAWGTPRFWARYAWTVGVVVALLCVANVPT